MITGLRLADVGDGLCATYHTPSGRQLMIDCGGRGHALRAAAELNSRQPSFFVLTHFHLDHYNGLATLEALCKQNICGGIPVELGLLPGIPQISKQQSLGLQFFASYLALQIATLGSGGNSARADFISILDNVCQKKPEFRCLFRGDNVELGHHNLLVLWPPKEITDATVSETVFGLLRRFEELQKWEPRLKEIFEQTERILKVTQDRVAPRHLFEADMITHDPPSDSQQSEPFEPELATLAAANQSIAETIADLERKFRLVANRLSLAFCIPDYILCLGDLNDTTIASALSYIHPHFAWPEYRYLLTAHHGTRWSDVLLEYHFQYACSSAGSLRNKVKSGYTACAWRHLITGFHGDFYVPRIL